MKLNKRGILGLSRGLLHISYNLEPSSLVDIINEGDFACHSSEHQFLFWIGCPGNRSDLLAEL